MSDFLYKAIIVGAGPAGLTAAYELSKKGQPTLVLESDTQYVGGISRTVEYHGYRFDIGGHRFFSKSQEVEDLWTEILGADLLQRPRSSKIYYRGEFYSYPLKTFEALRKLGFLESTLCVLSFLKARLTPTRQPKSFEDWVVNQFGERLFRIFFKTYTEKVWGMSCKEISADWAAQRIKGLSLGLSDQKRDPAKEANKRSRAGGENADRHLSVSTPWARDDVGNLRGKSAQHGRRDIARSKRNGLPLGRGVTNMDRDRAHSEGALEKYRAEHVISSMPIRHLVSQIEPPLPEAALQAAQALRYRDFLTVGLILREKNRFSDNWIYIYDPAVKVGRVQNYKSWSPEMVPDPAFCSYGLEYFCFEGDGLWTMPDEDLKTLAKKEIEQVGLGAAADVVDSCVIRQAKAYPVYDDDYRQHIATIREALAAHCPNLHLVGRNGMHKYNNQDHAMITAMLAARNIIAGEQIYDLWAVNEDAEYHESGRASEPSGSVANRMVASASR